MLSILINARFISDLSVVLVHTVCMPKTRHYLYFATRTMTFKLIERLYSICWMKMLSAHFE